MNPPNISIARLISIFIASEIVSREFVVGSFAVLNSKQREQFLNASASLYERFSPEDRSLFEELEKINEHRLANNK